MITTINYILALIILLFGFYILNKYSASINTRLFFLICFGTFFLNLFVSIGFDAAYIFGFRLSTIFIRLAAVMLFALYILIYRLSLSFPYELELRKWNIVLTGVFIIIASILVFTDLYVVKVVLRKGGFFRIEGILYRYISGFGLLIAIGSILQFVRRKAKFNNPIFSLQTNIIIFGLVLVLIIAVFISVVIPSVFKTFKYYPLGAVMVIPMITSLFYAITRYRLFSIKTTIHKTLLFLAFYLIPGLIVGGFIYLSRLIEGDFKPIVFMTGSALIFLLMIPVRKNFSKKLNRIFKRGQLYAKDLKDELNYIDFTRGHDSVISDLKNILSENIGTINVHILIRLKSGDLVEGNLKTDYIIKTDDPVFSFLAKTEEKIIFKTEILSNPVFSDIKLELMDLYIQLSGEVIIILMDRDEITGLIVLGKKETLKDYTDADYTALHKVLPKLFIIMYYIGNVGAYEAAKVLKQELVYCEQINNSISKTIDKIDSTAIKTEFITKSIDGLSGDLIDIINISNDESVIVIGSVSAKGILGSMSVIIIKSIIRTILKKGIELFEVASKVNDFIKQHLPREMYFSCIFMSIRFSKMRLEFVNCGIPIVYYVRKNTNGTVKIEPIQGRSKILGFAKNIKDMINTKKIDLKPADILFICTNSMIEGSFYPKDSNIKLSVYGHLKENYGKSAQEINKLLYEKILKFTFNSIKNDVTLFTIQIGSGDENGILADI